MNCHLLLKKVWLVMLSFLVIFSSLSGQMNIAAAEDPHSGSESDSHSHAHAHAHSGNIGDSDVIWSFDEDSGILTIGGKGKTETFSSKDRQPWASFRDEIIEVRFENMEELKIPDLAYWFTDCVNLTKTEIPYGAKKIGTDAFSGCDRLTQIMFYYGNDEDFSFESGAFKTEKSGKTSLYAVISETEAVKKIASYNWAKDNRSIGKIQDVYQPENLAADWVYNSGYFSTYYCSSCGQKLSITHDLQDNGTGHARYWGCYNSACSRNYHNGGGWQYMLQDQHVFSGGRCTYCGKVSSSSGSGGSSGTTPPPSGCSHINRYFTYPVIDGSSHYVYAHCASCNMNLGMLGTQVHIWAYINTSCTTMYACELCGYVDSVMEIHSEKTTYSSANDTYHWKDTECSVCGAFISSTYEQHNWQVSGYSNYTSTQHKITSKCKQCSKSKTEYGSHSDSNSDDKCDSCSAVLKVTLTWNASANGGTIGGSNSTTTKINTGGTGSVPSGTPVKTGYSFTGWFNSQTGGTKFSSSTTHSSNTTYYAQYSANAYTITWNVDGKTSTSSQKYDSTLTLPSNPTKSGYAFKGWYTAASGGTKVTASTVYKTAGATTYYAQWTANAYTVTWNVDGKTSTTSQTYNANLTLPTAPTKAGYTFKGWYTAASGGTKVTASTVYTTAGATTYYAQWTANSYTITWNVDGKTSTSSQTYNTNLTLPTAPTKTGYTFKGWYTAASGGTQVTASTVYTTAGATTYYAQWSVNSYTITWNVDGKTSTSSQTYNSNLILPTAPTKTGYTFKGWYTAASGGTQVTASTVYTTAGATTYYAQWSANSYSITWNVDGNTSTSSQVYNSNLILPTAPTKTGYTFKGWYTAASGGSQVTASTVYQTASTTTYYAQFSANKYQVLWNIDDETHVTTEQEYNKALTLPTPPEKKGYKFIGWYTKPNEGKKVSSNTIYKNASETEYFARWLEVLADKSKIVDMSYMFADCVSLTNLDLSRWGTGSTKNMSHMFAGCVKLADLDLSRFNTVNVKDMRFMFANCKSLEFADLTHFETKSISSMSDMFNGATALKEVEISTWELNSSMDLDNIFTGSTVVYVADQSVCDLILANSGSSVRVIIGPMP